MSAKVTLTDLVRAGYLKEANQRVYFLWPSVPRRKFSASIVPEGEKYIFLYQSETEPFREIRVASPTALIWKVAKVEKMEDYAKKARGRSWQCLYREEDDTSLKTLRDLYIRNILDVGGIRALVNTKKGLAVEVGQNYDERQLHDALKKLQLSLEDLEIRVEPVEKAVKLGFYTGTVCDVGTNTMAGSAYAFTMSRDKSEHGVITCHHVVAKEGRHFRVSVIPPDGPSIDVTSIKQVCDAKEDFALLILSARSLPLSLCPPVRDDLFESNSDYEPCSFEEDDEVKFESTKYSGRRGYMLGGMSGFQPCKIGDYYPNAPLYFVDGCASSLIV